VTFTAAQRQSLKRVFPHGMCNYNRPGAGQRGTIRWRTCQTRSCHVIYGGKPMGKPPYSVLLRHTVTSSR
jgi:hypothetical protein